MLDAIIFLSLCGGIWFLYSKIKYEKKPVNLDFRTRQKIRR